MPDAIEINISGVALKLFAKRGAYWADHSILFVADTHLGKGATFRKHSIPVPRGATESTLQTISEMLSSTGAKHLVILGDMFHAKSSLSVDVRTSVEHFFAQHHHTKMTLIRGNHDSSVGPLPKGWPIHVTTMETIRNVALAHHPIDLPKECSLLLCGHIHPAVRFGKTTDRLKLPCFWLHEGRLVFPAIGEFTGTEVIRPAKGDQVWAIAENEIVTLSH